jgi:TonB family protein
MKSGVGMFRMTVMIAILAVAGCASDGTRPADMNRVPLVSSGIASPSVHYDKTTGRCSSGMQLLSQAEYDSLRSAWTTPSGCKIPSKSHIPPEAGYPDAFGNFRKSGSAQVLVRLEANGSVESAHAVCATDRDFARAAEETAKAIRYEPAMCEGVPTRNTFLLPFNYDQ